MRTPRAVGSHPLGQTDLLQGAIPLEDGRCDHRFDVHLSLLAHGTSSDLGSTQVEAGCTRVAGSCAPSCRSGVTTRVSLAAEVRFDDGAVRVPRRFGAIQQSPGHFEPGRIVDHRTLPFDEDEQGVVRGCPTQPRGLRRLHPRCGGVPIRCERSQAPAACGQVRRMIEPGDSEWTDESL